MQVLIRDATAQDTCRVSITMREIDVAECRAAGHTPAQALDNALKMSALCWTGEVDGWPEAMFGVAPLSASTGIGSPWFLGSNKARKAQRAFLREAPEYLARIEALFPRLEGMVSERNTSARRWLVRMGFSIETHYRVLMHGEQMMRFSKGF
jgi:hypothetical protein